MPVYTKRLTAPGQRWLRAVELMHDKKIKDFNHRDRDATRIYRSDGYGGTADDELDPNIRGNVALLQKVQNDLCGAQIVPFPTHTDVVAFGNVVTVKITRGLAQRERRFMIDGYVMDIDPRLEVVDIRTSPLAQATLGLGVDEQAAFNAPGGRTMITVIKIELLGEAELQALDPSNAKLAA